MNFKEFETPEKLRGGYYTPHDLATFLGTKNLKRRKNSGAAPDFIGFRR